MTDPVVPQDGEPTEEIPEATGIPDETKAELERVRKALKAANSESAERRKKLEAFESAERERQEKELSEAQLMAKRLEEHQTELGTERQLRTTLEAELRTLRIQNAVTFKAIELGFENPADALALMDLSKVEITEDKKVKGFEDSLTKLAQSNRLPMKKTQVPIGTPRIPQQNGARPPAVVVPPVKKIITL